MRSTAFPWAVVVLSAIWSGVHPVEVPVPSTSYISTEGDDARGNGSRTRPWRTYSRARARGLPSQPANNVHFGPGVHSVGGGLLLGEADSGVVVSGEGPGITVLTGGTALPPWTVARDATTGRPLWSAPLAAASHPDGTAELHTQLFVQGGGGWGRGRVVPLRASVLLDRSRPSGRCRGDR